MKRSVGCGGSGKSYRAPSGVGLTFLVLPLVLSSVLQANSGFKSQKPGSTASTKSPHTHTHPIKAWLPWTPCKFQHWTAIASTVCKTQTNSFGYSALHVCQATGEEVLCTGPGRSNGNKWKITSKKQLAKCTWISSLTWLTIPSRFEGLKYVNIWITNDFVGSWLHYHQSSWRPVPFQNISLNYSKSKEHMNLPQIPSEHKEAGDICSNSLTEPAKQGA